jgi:hypothetical protein
MHTIARRLKQLEHSRRMQIATMTLMMPTERRFDDIVCDVHLIARMNPWTYTKSLRDVLEGFLCGHEGDFDFETALA